MYGKWMYRGSECARVPEDQIQAYQEQEYVLGRPFRSQPPKERARRSVPHLSNRRLEREYGISIEQQRAERAAGNKWCTFHKKYEPVANFHQRCKECKEGKKKIQQEQYKKYGRDRKYKVPKGWREQIMKFQGGHCALCPATEGSNGRRLAIDHDHDCCSTDGSCCGKCARGLLCDSCNAKVGYVEKLMKKGIDLSNADDWTLSAIRYIKSYKK